LRTGSQHRVTTSSHNDAAGDTPPVPSVSIVIPVYNESSRIGRALAAIVAYFDGLADPFEVIVVDDGSTDGTVAAARRYETSHPCVRVLAEPHRGKASAVLAGMSAATGSIVGFMDVDLATPLATWEPAQAAISRGAGVAIGSREGTGAARVGEPEYRHIMGRVFNGLVQLLLLPGIHDTQCGFKFFSRDALEDILPRQRLYRDAAEVRSPRVTAFDVELLFIARQHGHEIAVIPVTWEYGDHSKVNPLTDTIQNLRDVLTVRVNGWLGRYQ
jgi:glycosyltransferase involved in cell wall biosynthesis